LADTQPTCIDAADQGRDPGRDVRALCAKISLAAEGLILKAVEKGGGYKWIRVRELNVALSLIQFGGVHEDTTLDSSVPSIDAIAVHLTLLTDPVLECQVIRALGSQIGVRRVHVNVEDFEHQGVKFA
jgi:hypothetical protein